MGNGKTEEIYDLDKNMNTYWNVSPMAFQTTVAA